QADQLQDAEWPSRPDVEYVTPLLLPFESEDVRGDDVTHMDEVPGLEAILEDQGGVAVQQPAREDRRRPGIGVRQRLTRPVDVEVAERDRRNPVRLAAAEEHLLVIALGDRVDRRGSEGLVLGGREVLRLSAAGLAVSVPLAH